MLKNTAHHARKGLGILCYDGAVMDRNDEKKYESWQGTNLARGRKSARSKNPG
jgi:hypothetical protein